MFNCRKWKTFCLDSEKKYQLKRENDTQKNYVNDVYYSQT